MNHKTTKILFKWFLEVDIFPSSPSYYFRFLMKIQIAKVINDANINVLVKFSDRELLLKKRPLDQQISNKKMWQRNTKTSLNAKTYSYLLHVIIQNLYKYKSWWLSFWIKLNYQNFAKFCDILFGRKIRNEHKETQYHPTWYSA